MDIQELIEKLKEEKEKNHVRCVVANPAAIEVNNTFYQVDKALETAINYAEQLDEPQKVKVPAFVSREIVYYRAKGFSNSQIIEDAYNSNVPNQFTEWYWIGRNKHLFFEAVAYGCTVEKV